MGKRGIRLTLHLCPGVAGVTGFQHRAAEMARAVWAEGGRFLGWVESGVVGAVVLAIADRQFVVRIYSPQL